MATRPKRKTTKKQYSFADEAKAIAKRFPRRETDSIEARDYKQAMTTLMQEQEVARQAMGLQDTSQEFAMGGKKKSQLEQYYADQAAKGRKAVTNTTAKFAKDYMEPATIAATSALAGPAVLGALGKVGQGSLQAFKAANATGATDAWVVEQMAKGVPHLLKALPFTAGTEYLHAKAGTHNQLPLFLKSTDALSRMNDKVLGERMQSNVLPEVRVSAPRYTDRFTEKHSKAYGGRMKYSDGGVKDPRIEGFASTMQGIGTQPLLPETTNPYLSFDAPTTNYDTITNDILPVSSSLKGKLSDNLTPDVPKKTNIWDNPNMPSYISGASNIAGNLLLAGLANRSRSKARKEAKNLLNPAMATSKNINLESQRRQNALNTTTARNINLRNARNLGLNAGATIGNIGAANAALERNRGGLDTQSRLAEQQFNAQAANQASLYNAQARNRGAMMYNQMGPWDNSSTLAYLSGALGTVPGVMRDINLRKGDMATRGMYQNYINTLGNNYQYGIDLFGQSPWGYNVRG